MLLAKSNSGRALVLSAAVAMGLWASTGHAQGTATASSAVQQTVMPTANQPQSAAVEPSAPVQEATQSATSNQEIHILVGHSVVIRTDSRLKRVLVGSPTVLSTTTTAPNEVVITALAPGSSSVVMWQEDGHSRIIEAFADVDISMLRDTLQQSFSREHIQVAAEEGRVVLSGTVSSAAVADQVLKMGAPFAKDKELVNSLQIALPGRQRQVLLKVRFAEVDRRKLDAFGINLLSTGGANTIGTISTQQFGPPGLGDQSKLTGIIGAGNKGATTTLAVSDLLNLFIFRPDLNLGATVRDLEQKNVLQILAEPNLLAVSGEPAKFLAGGELPYPVVTGAGAGSAGTVSVQFKPFGVKLEFTGTVEDDGIIRLKVAPEVSSLDFTNAITVSGFVLPAIATRRAETVVELKAGQSFGIAGLLDQRTTAQLSKVPGIGDIPILGHLFKSRSTDRSSSELLVLVTPMIVDPAGSGATTTEIPKMPIPNIVPADFDKKLPGTPRGK